VTAPCPGASDDAGLDAYVTRQLALAAAQLTLHGDTDGKLAAVLRAAAHGAAGDQAAGDSPGH
jgi:hypothetical protein